MNKLDCNILAEKSERRYCFQARYVCLIAGVTETHVLSSVFRSTGTLYILNVYVHLFINACPVYNVEQRCFSYFKKK